MGALIKKFYGNIKKGFSWLRQNSKKFFWVWIIYQAVKGSLTTVFIWIPLIIYWLHH